MAVIKITEALNRGGPFFSFIIGLGISVLLFHRKYAVVRTLALPITDVVDKVVRSDGTCYRYRVEDATCEISSKQ